MRNRNRIKIEENIFEFIIPDILNKSTENALNEWCKLVESENNTEDVWTVIPVFPQYKFKNLRVEDCPFETIDENIETTINLTYDYFEIDHNYNKQKAIREDIIKRWKESGLLKGLHTSDKDMSLFKPSEKQTVDLPDSNSLLELTEQEKIDRVNGKDALPEGWIDWNKVPLEEMANMLEKKYKFNSSAEAKCIFELINFYREHKDCSEKDESSSHT